VQAPEETAAARSALRGPASVPARRGRVFPAPYRRDDLAVVRRAPVPRGRGAARATDSWGRRAARSENSPGRFAEGPKTSAAKRPAGGRRVPARQRAAAVPGRARWARAGDRGTALPARAPGAAESPDGAGELGGIRKLCPLRDGRAGGGTGAGNWVAEERGGRS
jgi:hypothetical protein